MNKLEPKRRKKHIKNWEQQKGDKADHWKPDTYKSWGSLPQIKTPVDDWLPEPGVTCRENLIQNMVNAKEISLHIQTRVHTFSIKYLLLNISHLNMEDLKKKERNEESKAKLSQKILSIQHLQDAKKGPKPDLRHTEGLIFANFPHWELSNIKYLRMRMGNS